MNKFFYIFQPQENNNIKKNFVMLQQNVPIIDIQNLGGWSRPDTLLRVYAHTVKKTQISAMNNLCATFIDKIK